MDLSKIKKIYMIGIKGVGLTALAQFFVAKGIEVLGSDIEEKFMTDKVLEKSGIKVIEGFNEKNIPQDADLIIHSLAFKPENNIEIAAAIKGKTKIVTYGEALGVIFNQNYGVAVCGSHGKTTTTAWLGYVLEKCGKTPSAIVGAQVPQFDGNILLGKSDYLVVEADEYGNKLKYLNPQAVLLNNIDYDHPDVFPTQDDYNQVFIDFIERIPAKGFLVANFDDKIVRSIANVNTRARVISYAINEAADYVAYNIKTENASSSTGSGPRQYFKVKMAATDEDDELSQIDLGDFVISLSGKHNVYNALAVIATCVEMEIDLVDIRTHLEDFTGTARRMQKLGEYRGALIIDDYAHHPAEIKATLAGARELYKDKKITVVFHPHTFTRTKALFNDFATSFGEADEVIVLDIYGSAREEQGGVSSKDLVDKIREQGTRSTEQIKYIPTLKEAEEYLRENVSRGDVVILMGAGDVFRVGENLVN